MKIAKALLFLFFFSEICFPQTISSKDKKLIPVGMFDSGTGGLTVFNELLKLDEFDNKTGAKGADGIPDFQNECFQYLADQANMPYGNYSAENKTDLLQEHIMNNMFFLLGEKYDFRNEDNQWIVHDKLSVKIIVIACNTATAYGYNMIDEYLKLNNLTTPIVGVVNAGVKAALEYQNKNYGAIGVFATAGTIASNVYPKTLEKLAFEMNIELSPIICQGGVGVAESIDRDWNYLDDTITVPRKDYKGPSLNNKDALIDLRLLSAYNFDRENNKLVCGYDPAGNCIEMQLNDPVNYIRYHLVSLLEKMIEQNVKSPMNTLILGCTHYPYLRDQIKSILKELYDFSENGTYRYREFLASDVELIDPAFETAKEVYLILREEDLLMDKASFLTTSFYISVPNLELSGIELQSDGWFTYAYKYGRNAGENKSYVKYTPFDSKNISEFVYNRIKLLLPETYERIEKYLNR